MSHRSQVTVQRIYQYYIWSEDFHNIIQKPGCKCLFTAHDTCVATHVLTVGKAHDVVDLQRKFFPSINVQTICVRLWQCGLQAYEYHKQPLLIAAHKEKRLAWAKAHANWTIDNWKAVIFSDKSKLTLFRMDGHEWCWRALWMVLEGSWIGFWQALCEEIHQTWRWECYGLEMHHSSGARKNLSHRGHHECIVLHPDPWWQISWDPLWSWDQQEGCLLSAR